jgi:hypothetical protein
MTTLSPSKNPLGIVPDTVIGNNKFSFPVYDERDGGKHERIQYKTWREVTGGAMDYSNYRSYGTGGSWQGKGWEEIQEKIMSLYENVQRDKKRKLGKWFRVQAARVGNYGIQLILID